MLELSKNHILGDARNNNFLKCLEISNIELLKLKGRANFSQNADKFLEVLKDTEITWLAKGVFLYLILYENCSGRHIELLSGSANAASGLLELEDKGLVL
ncbi:hypothetical protein GCM10010912_69240 [Paenibacillus albidus]|uniref:Uncharacterized protein n=1 Tax=Paenibacillus albidus TaxID=2041023 RepID=A0A917FZ84_9BACL|nr:hypothetical protein [Paenibacillus albidus]GGG14971.1 hypothetical protein GCM10010912_69240 [Paenibacillus albidus]